MSITGIHYSAILFKHIGIADFAERFEVAEREKVGFGDAVCMNGERKVRKCSSHGEMSVGIVGVVKTKVQGRVEQFAMLTTSAHRGYAEKAGREDFGAILGKAMEPCGKDECVIEALAGLG